MAYFAACYLLVCLCVIGYVEVKGSNDCGINNQKCHANATCANKGGGFFQCICKNGYTGNGTNCTDIDECTDSSTNNCHSNAKCTNTAGSFSCACKHGFKQDGVFCEDVDECAGRLDNCDSNSQCNNIVGSFTCKCNDGYTGDGMHCSDIDECLSSFDNCHSNAYCTNVGGSFLCTCDKGYTGNGIFCQDIDECALSYDNCSQSSYCRNLHGSFQCICNDTYAGNTTNCEATTMAVRLKGSSSINGTGRVEVFYKGQWGSICSYGWDINDATVVCRQLGYKKAFRAFLIDEQDNRFIRIWLRRVDCTGNEPNLTSCSNNGWRNDNYCSRHAGVDCSSSDVNECSRGTDNCGSNSQCINTDGSFSCECNYGYTGDGVYCSDINECSVSTDNCDSTAYCINTEGSYQCICDNGYVMNQAVCQDIDECSLSIYNCNQGSNCSNVNGTYLCIPDGSKNATLCQENSIAVRLRGPLSANGTGRVEILHSGQWASICDDNWNINNARVVCLQLGYKYGVRAIRGGQVLPGSGSLWLHDMNCTGHEQCLSSCSHRGWVNQNCTHFNDAGVECSYTEIPLRLQGPSKDNGTGRVEVFYKGQWGTICNRYWNKNDAAVVCRQLGYKYGNVIRRGPLLPVGFGQIWLSNVVCTGREQNLTSCSHSGWGNNDCQHYEDAGVECFSTEISIAIRLQGPFSANGTGRVEIFYRGQWGTICGYGWDINIAKVVCRELGYQYGVKGFRAGRSHPGSGKIWLGHVRCSGSEKNLTSCTHLGWGNHYCSHYWDVGIECSSKGVRLRGPLSANGTGRVEILNRGQWGTICDDGWEINEARVVCRELGYKYAIRALRGGQVPSGFGQIWLDDVRCTGSEEFLTTCSHKGWGNHNCVHKEDAGVECSSTVPVNVSVKPKKPVVTEHSSVVLSCACECSGWPSWFKENQSIHYYGPGSTYLLLTNGSLRINASRYAAGNYSCQVRTSFWTLRSRPIKLDVQYLDDSNLTGDRNIYEGQNISLTCHGNGNPFPQYTWYFNGQQLKINSRITIQTNRLGIFNATTSEGGEYKCVASNRIGRVEKRIHVIVRG